jgi:endonuclease YncB( thermonuclease family)
MRAIILPVAALALAGAVVLVGGRMVETPVVIDEPDAEAIAAAGEPSTATKPSQGDVPVEDQSLTAQPSKPAQPAVQPATQHNTMAPSQPTERPKDTARSRLVAPAVVAPPDLAANELQREAPREPLSQLSLALPPKPEMKNEWAGTAFFRPVAVESAVFESMGRTIAISGVKSVPVDESCDYEGVAWQCGARARTAFRLWLRGRALVCQLPDEEQAVTSARCRLAKQDAGAWLVANGWALAAPGGPYVQAEEKARAEGMGIFGEPPDTSSISAVPDAPPTAPGESQPIMTEDGVDPQPALGPELEFPPAPPP